jgi:hypothetical protein
MATTQVPVPAPPEAPDQEPRAGLLDYLTTVDHKKIGILYLYTAFGVFFAGGILAMLVRAENPGESCTFGASSSGSTSPSSPSSSSA